MLAVMLCPYVSHARMSKGLEKGVNPLPMAIFSQRLDISKAVDETGRWKHVKIKEASDVNLLTGSGESGYIPFTVTSPGRHSIWLRIYTDKDRAANMLAIVRAPNGEAVCAERIDAPIHWLNPAKPYLEHKISREAGFRFCRFETVFEYPGAYSINLSNAVTREGGRRLVESIYVSNDAAFDPAVKPAVSTVPPQAVAKVPAGFLPAKVYPLHVSLYTGIEDAKRRFKAGLIQNGAIYLDPSAMVLMGVTHQQGIFGNEKINCGLLTFRWAPHADNSSAFVKSIKSPEGRFVNAEGTVGSGFSLSWDPALQDALANGRERMLKSIADKAIDKTIGAWCICGEAGGNLDYSPYSVDKFRIWLKNKYGTIERLNSAWRSDFKDFAAIYPAKSPEEKKTNWLEFRDFSSKLFATVMAQSVKAVNSVDPMKRPATTQLSNLDLFASDYARFRPHNFEDMILIGLKETDNIGWDAYCADDYMGAEVDLMDSLGRGKKMLLREFNTHNQNVEIAARTYWTTFGKGARGISLFQFHEGGGHDSYPKWALTNKDMTPRDKLGAFSDQMQEIHRLESIVVEAKKVYPVKPVAIFYNKIDMTLSKAPLSSSWGEGIDTPYHLYEMLRGRGYPVTFTTDSQIRDGFLKNFGAVVFADAQHISAEACDRIVEWVNAGGAVIGDTWPGTYTELGHRQNTLLDLFGIRPRDTKKVDKIKLEESPQGYGEITVAAINPDTLYNTVMETWQQWDSEHPVARKTGNWMFSGYGRSDIVCTAGEVVGMVFDGHPGVVVNRTGKGHSLYISTMLGSLYGGSASRYEWDTAHADLSPARLLDAFLEFAGIRKLSIAGLPERQAYKLRVEAPLIDEKGNGLITMVSYNDTPLPAFHLKIAWPAGVKIPRKIFSVTGGSRQALELPFKFANGMIELNIPGFNSHAALLAISDSVPLLSLEFPNAGRDVAGLVTMTPNSEAKVKVTVHNLSGKPVSGRVTARLPEGWFYDKESVSVGKIAPWRSGTVVFTIKAPSFCAARRVRPISFLFEGDGRRSMPATEAVWWQAKEE